MNLTRCVKLGNLLTTRQPADYQSAKQQTASLRYTSPAAPVLGCNARQSAPEALHESTPSA